jgi:ABC-type Fe3+/spermidine/putrescine transport system ATPase subunit
MVISDRIAVLERGRVAQVGSADDLFHRPRTRFVAEFIGKTNVVDGMAVKVDTVSHGTLTFRVASDRLVPGAHVALSIRPHQIAIVEPGAPSADGGNVLRGTIQRASFLGETVDYQVAVEGTKLVLRVATPATGRLRTGETVGLRIDREACVVLADA